MKLDFQPVQKSKHHALVPDHQWTDWSWQMRFMLKSLQDFERIFILSEQEKKGLASATFKIGVTPYYASLAGDQLADPIRKIFMPSSQELVSGTQQMSDPLGELKNQKTDRIIHRYSDRVLFWVTDTCGVYCRYCLRKHFTGQDHAVVREKEYQEALNYIAQNPGIREVILSGGDPLTLSDENLERILGDIRKIEHIEIIRIGTRLPTVNPFRVTDSLVKTLKKNNPVYVMTHFNHPKELTLESRMALEKFVDSGIPVFNQMVLLNGVNNHAAIVQALSRRLMFLRVKPYYMFQCDPSMGTDHLRTSVDSSLEIQRELWGHISGLAMPSLSLDIPNGGGKAYYVPNFQLSQDGAKRTYKGWDGIESSYISPPEGQMKVPSDLNEYMPEWMEIKNAKSKSLKASKFDDEFLNQSIVKKDADLL